MNRRVGVVMLAAGALCWGGAPAVGGEHWPRFRGPTGLGYSDEKSLPVEWGGTDDTNVRWKSPLTGEGHASPIVWGDRLFTCTVRWADDVVDRKKVMPDHFVTCYRAADGKVLWRTPIKPGPWLRSDFRSGAGGGYAAPTPCTDGKHVFVVFGSAVMAALDFDGHIVWRHDIRPYSFDVTIGASPVLYKDTVILLSAMAKPQDSRLTAFDKATGQVRWLTKMPTTAFGHSTPLLIHAGGRAQLITLASGMKTTGDALQAFDPANGKRLWWCRGAGDAASPAYADGLLYFDSGRGSPGVAVDPTGAGDVSKTHVRWTIARVPTGIGSPVIVGDYVYRLHTPNVLKCWHKSDGKRVYAQRLDGLTSTWASPVVDANGRLYFASGGTSVVVQSGPNFKVLSTNKLNDANHASAAAASGRLYLMGLKHLYCIANK